jgi:uncharacterized protein (TIGR02284 family)
MSSRTEAEVQTLNSFLRGEISAVETYKKALDHVKAERLRSELEALERDHEARVAALRERIEKLGGQPAESSGVWGTFAKVVQAGADAVGEKAAIAALEEGEDHGLADYKRDVDQLHGEQRRFAKIELLPAQQRTHDRLSKLKKTLH